MKVLFIAGTLGQGGAENQLFLLAKSLKCNNTDVVIISLTKGEYWEEILINNDIKVINLELNLNRMMKLVQIINITKVEKPDIIYSFHFFTSMYAAFSGFITNTFSIGSIRSNGWLENKHNGFWKYFHFNLPNAIIGNSKHGLEVANKLFGLRHQRVGVLNNAIDTQKFNFRGRFSSIDKFRIIFIGRLIPIKRPQDFLRITQMLRDCGIPVEATILGDGPMRLEIEKMADGMGIKNIVTFAGNVPNAYNYLKNSNAFIHCAEAEGTPNAVLEAMSTGVPVYCSNIFGIDSLLGENNERGFVYHSLDELFVKLQKQFYEGANDETVFAANKHIQQNYSMDFLSNNFCSLISILKGAKDV
jgi:glycosyltransferase involved in cell wall biosynthesis